MRRNTSPQIMALRSFTPNGAPVNPEGSLVFTCYTGIALIRPVREKSKKFPSGRYKEVEMKIYTDRDTMEPPKPGFYIMKDGILLKD